MMKTLSEAEEYLHEQIPTGQTEKFPGELGLERMQELLNRLGNPQHSLSSIHIAGTAGKGSTSFFAAKILQSAGLKTGLHISPHLETVRERIQIDGQIITEEEFASLVSRLKLVINQMSNYKHGKPSYFEVLAAMAFVYFAQNQVEAAVIETGLGGRYDATNVLNSIVSMVTNVGLDHTQILGDTREKILQDKMRIIKTGNSAAVTGIDQPDLLEIIAGHAARKQVPLKIFDKDFHTENHQLATNGSTFDYLGNMRQIRGIQLSAPGEFQIENAALAITACLEFATNKRFILTDQQIKAGLENAQFPGRLEVVSAKPLMIIDGAHNSDKVGALVGSIKKIYTGQKFMVLFGLKKNKNAQEILELLKPITAGMVITQFSKATDMGLNLGFPAEELQAVAKKVLDIPLIMKKNPLEGLESAKETARKQELPLLATGSLYLIGEIRSQFS